MRALVWRVCKKKNVARPIKKIRILQKGAFGRESAKFMPDIRPSSLFAAHFFPTLPSPTHRRCHCAYATIKPSCLRYWSVPICTLPTCTCTCTRVPAGRALYSHIDACNNNNNSVLLRTDGHGGGRKSGDVIGRESPSANLSYEPTTPTETDEVRTRTN